MTPMVFFLLLMALLWCWAMYKAAIYALPLGVGYYVGGFAFETAAGGIGAFVVGGFVALVTYVAFQVAFARAQSQMERWLIAGVFVGPSVIMSYNITLDLFANSAPLDRVAASDLRLDSSYRRTNCVC